MSAKVSSSLAASTRAAVVGSVRVAPAAGALDSEEETRVEAFEASGGEEDNRGGAGGGEAARAGADGAPVASEELGG